MALVVKLPATMSFTTWFSYSALNSKFRRSTKVDPSAAVPVWYACTGSVVPSGNVTLTEAGIVQVTWFTMVGPLSRVCQDGFDRKKMMRVGRHRRIALVSGT